MITVEEFKIKTTERLYSKIKFSEPDECWEWMAGMFNDGYGAYYMSNTDKKAKNWRASRAVYFFIYGDFDYNLLVLHTCDNPKCVNPNHLFVGTHRDNTDDKMKKGRHKYVTRRGEECTKSKLSNDDVYEIKRRLKNGETHRSIASYYKVAHGTIGCINRETNWKHLFS